MRRKIKEFPFKFGTIQVVCFNHTNIVLEVPAKASEKGQRTGTRNGKEKVKASIFADCLTLYKENCTGKLLIKDDKTIQKIHRLFKKIQ